MTRVKTLDDVMHADHVVKSEGGKITDQFAESMYAPSVYVDAYWDEHGDCQIMRHHELAMGEQVERDGWEVITGFSGQYLSHGTGIMHDSERIGTHHSPMGKLILENPGYYVAVVVEINTRPDDERYENENPEPAGWVLLFKEFPYDEDGNCQG